MRHSMRYLRRWETCGAIWTGNPLTKSPILSSPAFIRASFFVLLIAIEANEHSSWNLSGVISFFSTA